MLYVYRENYYKCLYIYWVLAFYEHLFKKYFQFIWSHEGEKFKIVKIVE